MNEEISEEMQRVILSITESNPDILKGLYAVGDWLWLEFDSKPDENVRNNIKALGFHWNKRRKLWQCSCGVYSRPSEDDPRIKYPMARFA